MQDKHTAYTHVQMEFTIRQTSIDKTFEQNKKTYNIDDNDSTHMISRKFSKTHVPQTGPLCNHDLNQRPPSKSITPQSKEVSKITLVVELDNQSQAPA